MKNDFVHLHLHSQYSLLDGAIKLPAMMDRLNEFGMKSVAVTDHGNMFGAVDFYKKAKKAGIKPILGVEAYVAAGDRTERVRGNFHLVLLARNNVGYANLRKLVSTAWLDGLYYKPRMDLKVLREHNEGIIALSACLGSQIAQTFMKQGEDKACEMAIAYRDTFEPGMFFLEVQPNGMKEQEALNKVYRRFNKELGIPLVATNDCHYIDQKFAKAHDVLMCIQMAKTLDDPNRMRHESDAYWLKPAEVMWAQMGETFPDALDNTVRIAEMCNVELDLGSVYLPNFPVPEGHDIESYLKFVSRQGLDARFKEFATVDKVVDRAEYDARLQVELDVICGMGFPGYFMIVWDFIAWTKKQGIPVGPGRGSGAGSLVAYALRITDIDPLPYGLLFERFLNPERVSMPDFDIDFCMNRRGEVIEYVTQKYGKNQVGQIATFGSLKARGVIKDVGRVLGMTFADTDRLTKLVPEVLGITLDEALEQEPKLRTIYETEPKIKELLDLARNLEGLHRNSGMHAAGVVIGDKPLWEYCPVYKGSNDELITMFAKDEVEDAGLIKFDFLGLKTLTVIDDAVKMVNRRRPKDEQLDLSLSLLDDPKVYELISRGDTEGVFQMESGGFQEMIVKLKPNCFEDIVAAVALYRPGPMGMGMDNQFINRKHGREKVTYPHPKLEGLLKDTYGVIVYQEQVMQIAQVLAGYSLGGADILRRAMGKKKASVMAEQRAAFQKGAVEGDVDLKVATEIFDLMESFAAYGFNKSHSAAYAMLTYQTAYLKAYHRIEFMASVLTNDRDNAEKVAKGIRNAQKIGIEVLAPSVNHSRAFFDSVDGKILFGMEGVKGVGSMAVEGIVSAREVGGEFRSLFDFCARVDLKKVNKKTIVSLIATGAFDFAGQPRARLTAAVDAAVDRGQRASKDRVSGQANLFGMLAAPPSAPAAKDDDTLPPELMKIEEWPDRVLLAKEKGSLGFYVSGHPLDRFQEQIDRHATETIEGLKRRAHNDRVVIAGIISSCQVKPLKSGKGNLAVLLFEDTTGMIEAIAMTEAFDKYEALLTSDEPLLMVCSVSSQDRDGDPVRTSLRVGTRRRRGEKVPEDAPPDVVSLATVREERARGVELNLRCADISEDKLRALAEVLSSGDHRGECGTFLNLLTDDDCVVRLRAPHSIRPTDELNDALRRIFGSGCEFTTS